MKVAVLGLWHLGSVTAACVANAGFDVVAFDPDAANIARLQQGMPPVSEPGLAELMAQCSSRLRFTNDAPDAVRGATVVWVTFDTPVDGDDRADVDYVVRQIEALFPHLENGAVMLSSSQLPVGTTRRLEAAWAPVADGRSVSFAVSPENLRLGKAIEVFTQPDRVVVGVRDERAQAVLAKLLKPITERIEWMSVESAEMTKHAINAFLAASVTFINELAALCEETGADAKEVERGLKTEKRIGHGAYLGPGAAFAGGTLARDVVFLGELGKRVKRETPLIEGILRSNLAHRGWATRRITSELGNVRGKKVAVWGLTYKPGTDTLRRSMAVELCEWLAGQGAQVAVHDPAVGELPATFPPVARQPNAIDAARQADAIVVATEWPEYRQVTPAALLDVVKAPVILDANGFLRSTLGADPRIRLISVGQAPRA